VGFLQQHKISAKFCISKNHDCTGCILCSIQSLNCTRLPEMHIVFAR
jgi:hypothetical protein